MYNLSVFDGILRLFLGSIIAAVFGAFEMWPALIAPYFIVTGLGGYCPLYHALGWSTVEDQETNSHHNEEVQPRKLNSASESRHAA